MGKQLISSCTVSLYGKVWFQNRRTKHNKEEQQQQQQNKLNREKGEIEIEKEINQKRECGESSATSNGKNASTTAQTTAHPTQTVF